MNSQKSLHELKDSLEFALCDATQQLALIRRAIAQPDTSEMVLSFDQRMGLERFLEQIERNLTTTLAEMQDTRPAPKEVA